MCRHSISPHCSPFNSSASYVTRTEASSIVADPSDHLPPMLVSRTMQIASLIASLSNNHSPPPTSTHLCDTTKAVLASSCQILTCVCLPPLSLSTTCISPVSSPTQDEVYEGVGDLTIFSLTCATCTRLPAHRRTTMTTTFSPVLLLQTVIVNTSTSVPPLHCKMPKSSCLHL